MSQARRRYDYSKADFQRGTLYRDTTNPKERTVTASNGGPVITDDVVGNRIGANPFNTTYWSGKNFALGGSLYNTFSPYQKLKGFDNCPDALVVEGPPHPPEWGLNSWNSNDTAWTILANTNPSNAHFSVPTFIGELKDVPSLFKSWGDNLLSMVASGYITWKWALRPMVSDVQAMMTFQKAVDDRIRMLEKLKTVKYLGKRCGLSSSEKIVPPVTVLVQSENAFINAQVFESHTVKRWGSARYNVTKATVLPPTADGVRNLAKRLTFGITSYEGLLTAWELMPWSWLQDWFIGIGTVLQACNNTIQLTSSDVCFMQTFVSERRYVALPRSQSDAWATVGGSKFNKRVTKQRHVVSALVPFLLAKTPFLDRSKWQILGSLAVLGAQGPPPRKRRKRRTKAEKKAAQAAFDERISHLP